MAAQALTSREGGWSGAADRAGTLDAQLLPLRAMLARPRLHSGDVALPQIPQVEPAHRRALVALKREAVDEREVKTVDHADSL